VREIAKGRVWTGAQAQTLGLVDQIGDFHDAVIVAKQLGGVAGEARLKSFDADTSPLDAVKRMFGLSTAAARVFSAIADLGAEPSARALAGQASDAVLRTQGATVLAPRLVP
jgi:protease-4